VTDYRFVRCNNIIPRFHQDMASWEGVGPSGPKRDEQAGLDHQASYTLARILGALCRPPASRKISKAQATASIVRQCVTDAPHVPLSDDADDSLASVHRLAPFEAPRQVQIAYRTNEHDT
jgi:hypothetical protein